jgi:hypothetical protein
VNERKTRKEENAQDVLSHVQRLSSSNNDDRSLLEPIYQLPPPLLIFARLNTRCKLSRREEVRVSGRKRLSEPLAWRALEVRWSRV